MAFSPADSPYFNLPDVALLALLDQRDRLLAAQVKQLADKDILLAKADNQLLELVGQIKKVQRTLDIRNKKIFGSTSEKLDAIVPEAPKEGYIHFEEVNSSEQAAAETSEIEKPKRKYKKPHLGRIPLPADLERRDIHLYPEAYQPGEATELPPIITERLAMNLDIFVERLVRHKYIQAGKLLSAPFPIDDPCFRCKFSLSLVTHMLMLRFVHHMPYYRVIQLLPKNIIGYNTLAGAASWAFDLLAPLAPVLLEEVKLDATRLNIDETTFDSLDRPENIVAFKRMGRAEIEEPQTPAPTPEPPTTSQENAATIVESAPAEKEVKVVGKKKVIHTGRVWVLGNEQAGLVYYEYTATRAACVAERLLEGYSGLLMSDAYAAYISIAGQKDSKITLMLCWAHGRRRFTELAEKGTNKTDPVVLEVIRRIGELYQIEKKIKGQPDADKLTGRLESTKLLASLKTYLDAKVLFYTPKEGVAEAIKYLLNHWPHFTAYTNFPAGSLDNNYIYPNFIIITIIRSINQTLQLSPYFQVVSTFFSWILLRHLQEFQWPLFFVLQ